MQYGSRRVSLLAVLTVSSFASVGWAQSFPLYVTEGSSLVKYDSSGDATTFATGAGDGDLAFDANGNLFVADGSLVNEVSPQGVVTPYAAGFSSVSGITLDSSGNLYVADIGADTVSKITPAGDRTTFASDFNSPSGIAFGSNGNLFVINNGNNLAGQSSISEVPAGGGTASTFASGYTGFIGIAFDRSGNLYAASATAGDISEFDASGVATTFASGLGTADDVAFDNAGNLFVTDLPGGDIYEVSTDGNVSTFASGIGVEEFPLRFGGPGGLAFSVPEPSSLALLAVTACLTLRRRRKV